MLVEDWGVSTCPYCGSNVYTPVVQWVVTHEFHEDGDWYYKAELDTSRMICYNGCSLDSDDRATITHDRFITVEVVDGHPIFEEDE